MLLYVDGNWYVKIHNIKKNHKFALYISVVTKIDRFDD